MLVGKAEEIAAALDFLLVPRAKLYSMLTTAGIPRVNYAPAVEFGHLTSQDPAEIERGWDKVIGTNEQIDDILARAFLRAMALQDYFHDDEAGLEHAKDVMTRPFSEGGCNLIIPGRFGSAMRLCEEIKYAARRDPTDRRPPRDKWDELGAYGALLKLAERNKDMKNLHIREFYQAPNPV